MNDFMKFYINEEKRTVVCKIISDCYTLYPYKTFVGKAKCDPEDKFDVEKGKKIAKLRAYTKYNKNELKDIRKEKAKIEKKFKDIIRKEVDIMDLIDNNINALDMLTNED